MPLKPQVTVLSSVPGRERWEVEGLRGKVALASALEYALLSEEDITAARVSPLTGRVLLFFPPDQDVRSKVLIQTHLEAILARGLPVQSSEVTRKTSRNALVQLLRAAPLTSQHGRALLLSLAVQLIAVARRVTLISTINLAIGSAGGAVVAGPGIVPMTAALLVMIAVEGVLEHFRTIAWEKLARDTEERIRGPLLRHLQHQDVLFFERQGTGRLINLVNNDVAKIGGFIESVGDQLAEGVISVLWAGGMLLWIAPTLFGLSLIPLPFVVLTAWALGPRVARTTALASSTMANYSQQLGNSLAGIIDIKNFTAEDREANKLIEHAKEADVAAVGATSASSLQYEAIQGLFGTGFTLAIGYAGSLVMSGQAMPDRTLHVLYWFPNLMSSVAKLHGVSRQYHAAVRASENILKVMHTEPEIVSGPLGLPRPDRCEITFDSVDFGYEPGVEVLKDVSFTVKPGKMLAVVGPTGSGKSTLLRLLLRHYEVNRGSIRVNGQDIRELNLQELRRAIGVVSQDVYLFQGSLKENVLYGRPDASEGELAAALRNSGTEAFLDDLPAGSESEVGERGHRLSGGQRQRIAIARALLKEAPVLALDEATSQLDYETESIVQRSVNSSSKKRTLIVVAHRLSTIRRADEILVLEGGRIRERGTHEELVHKTGLYASLWKLQNGNA
jgi:ATP-binding cassette, subfamily B, bacterial